MNDTTTQTVPRTPTEPSAEELLDEMDDCTPYTISDFDQKYDVSRWTIRRRLESLHEDGKINRRKHSENVHTWWIDPGDDTNE